MTRYLTIALVAFLALTSPAGAHHGAADLFDSTKTIEVKGLVKEWRLVNPHPILRLEVTEANGEQAVWDVSFGPSAASTLRRRGYSPETFKPGTLLIAKGHPAKTPGVRGVDISGKDSRVTREDGTPIP
jgi:Family of unknown function (DUF6152)